MCVCSTRFHINIVQELEICFPSSKLSRKTLKHKQTALFVKGLFPCPHIKNYLKSMAFIIWIVNNSTEGT